MFDLKRGDKLNYKDSILANVKIPTVDSISKITSLYWSEHCVECSAPACYKTCLLYADDGFGKCSRFPYGFRRIPISDNNLYNHAIQLKYKQWGKLWTFYNEHLTFKTKS
ncbi:MAG TPA: hypothetical protein VKA27_14370, partial [Sunxiuqinia sp.]|nr:hypothetical protein [Sunxiuqinia sp.]